MSPQDLQPESHFRLAAPPVVTAPNPPDSVASRTTAVLHLINGQHYSGAERVQDLLGSGMPAFGYRAGFACLKSGRFAAQRRSRACRVHEVPMRHRLDRRPAGPLCQLIGEYDYRLLHAHTPRSLMMASRVAGRLGLPLVYHVHSPAGRDSTRWFSNRINRRVESRMARHVDHFVCVSHSLRDYMESLGHDPYRLSVVPNGVAVIPELPDRKRPRGTWTLGMTALFRPRKGVEVLIEALALLRQRGRPVRLLAVGPFESAEYRDRITTLARQRSVAGLVEWAGFSGDVPGYLQQMDLFVLPSLFGEGLPMVVLEAMASGVPVVAARVEGTPEAIRDGVDGRLFDPGNPVALADCIEQVMQGNPDWMSLRDSALQRQRRGFSDVSMARGVAGIYDQLLNR